MISTNVFAKWTVVDGGVGMAVYGDTVSIKKKGNKVNMWSLNDYKTVQESSRGERYLSTMAFNEYDCEEETNRLLDLYFYSGHMRGGEIVLSIPNIKDETKSVLPGSIEEELFKFACSKK
jgi:hypothetical protein